MRERQESGSFLKKRTKKLLLFCPTRESNREASSRPQQTKVFWFFFSKKNCFFFLRRPIMPRPSIFALYCLLLPVPAFAHAFLDGAAPRVGSEIPAAPTEVVLHFTQGVEPDFSKIEVQDSAGASVTDGAPHSAGDPTHFAVPLKKIGPGVYTVIWHVTSVDTHKTQGKFHFTVTQ
jgi:methionine-rich copper-binding protein CopC